MSRANEILKEKFGISTEDKSLEQVLNEIMDKYNALDEDSQKELEELIVGERKREDMKRGLRRETRVIDEASGMSDEECELMMSYFKATGESGKLIGDSFKSIYKTIKESKTDEEREELEKLTKEFKAKDWI